MNDESFLKIEQLPRAKSMFLHPSPDIDIKVIKQIGDYSLGAELGSGAFGKVVLGKHILTNELVAIKILDKIILSQTPDDYLSVKQEINILKSVKHKHIVQLYDVLQTSRHIFIIMEYCEGKDLLDYILTKSKLTEEESLKYFHQLINALFYLHSQNIAHRDIKIDNMLLDRNRDLKLVDFGLSTKYPDDNLLDQPCGTVVYAAPEVLQGREYHGMLADVWSSGIVLYGMLSGYLPFGEQDDEVNKKNIIMGNIKFPSYFSECVKDLLSHMLDLDPMTRYTLQEVRSHPWFNLIDYKLIPGIIIGYNIIPVDEKILNLCVTYNCDKEKVRSSVMNNKFNSESALYYLLIKKLQKKGFHSVSDFCSDEFIHFVLDDNNLVENKTNEQNPQPNQESEIKYNININKNNNASAPPDGKLRDKENHPHKMENYDRHKDINRQIDFNDSYKISKSFVVAPHTLEEPDLDIKVSYSLSNFKNGNIFIYRNNESKKTNKNTSSDSRAKYYYHNALLEPVTVNHFQIIDIQKEKSSSKIDKNSAAINHDSILLEEKSPNLIEYKILNINSNNKEDGEKRILTISNDEKNISIDVIKSKGSFKNKGEKLGTPASNSKKEEKTEKDFLIETPTNNIKNIEEKNASKNTLSRQKVYIDKIKTVSGKKKADDNSLLEQKKIKDIRKINLFQEEIKEDNVAQREDVQDKVKDIDNEVKNTKINNKLIIEDISWRNVTNEKKDEPEQLNEKKDLSREKGETNKQKEKPQPQPRNINKINENKNKSSTGKNKKKQKIKKKKKKLKNDTRTKKNPMIYSIIKNYKVISDTHKSLEMIKDRNNTSKEKTVKKTKNSGREITSIKVIVNKGTSSKGKKQNLNKKFFNNTEKQEVRIKSIYRITFPRNIALKNSQNISKSNKKQSTSIFKNKLLKTYFINKKYLNKTNNKPINNTHVKSSSIHSLGTVVKNKNMTSSTTINSLAKGNIKAKNNKTTNLKFSVSNNKNNNNNYNWAKSYNKYMHLFKSTQYKNNNGLTTKKMNQTNLNKKFDEIAKREKDSTKYASNSKDNKKIPLWKYIQSNNFNKDSNSTSLTKIKKDMKDNVKNKLDHSLNKEKEKTYTYKNKMRNNKSLSSVKNKNINLFFINIQNYINNNKNENNNARKRYMESSTSNNRYKSPNDIRELSETTKNKYLNKKTRYTKVPWKIKKKAIDEKIDVHELYNFYMNKNKNLLKKNFNHVSKVSNNNNIKSINYSKNNKVLSKQTLYYLNNIKGIKYNFKKSSINKEKKPKNYENIMTTTKKYNVGRSNKKNNFTPQVGNKMNENSPFKNAIHNKINPNKLFNNSNEKNTSNIFDLSCLFSTNDNLTSCYQNIIKKLTKNKIYFVQKKNKSIRCFKNGFCTEIEIHKLNDGTQNMEKGNFYCINILGKNGGEINNTIKNIIFEG